MHDFITEPAGFSLSLFVKEKRETKKESQQQNLTSFFPSGQKTGKFIKKPQNEKSCNHLTNHCVPLDQPDHLPIFGLVSSGFAPIVTIIFPYPPVNVHPGRQ